MILVGQFDSPYVRRVAIAMHLLERKFERNPISAFADAEAMRRINPLGRIPSLVLDDGEVLIDSGAILDYLDEEVRPDRTLLPPSGGERRRALRLTALACGTIDKAGAVVYELTTRPVEKQYGPWIERCRVQFESGLAALERETPAQGWYLGGRRPLLPDITAGCLVGYLRLGRLPDVTIPPKLARLADACEALAAFQETRASADERRSPHNRPSPR